MEDVSLARHQKLRHDMDMWKWIKATSTVFGALVVLMASVPAKDAASNISSYFECVGLAKLAAYLGGASADQWAVLIGASFFASGILGFFVPKFLVQKAKAENVIKRGAEQSLAVEKQPLAVERDVWVLDAFYYIAFGSWDVPDWRGDDDKWPDDMPGAIDAFFRASQGIQQYAVDGKLPIWGRTGFSGPQVKIPPRYWEYHGFSELKVFTADREDLATEVERPGYKPMAIYHGLMTSKAKVEELWPANG